MACSSPPAPPRGPVQRALVGSLVVQCVVAVVVASVRLYSPMAFGILAPMWALGFTGLWVAAYGTFPERTPEPTERRCGTPTGGLTGPAARADRRGRTE